jgi:hypothetical protein
MVGSVSAKTVSTTTTLWEGVYSGDINISLSSITAGATINIYFNWLGTDGAQFSCFWYKESDQTWPNIYNWQWVDNGEEYFSFVISQDQLNEITWDKLGFKSEATDKMTISKITETVYSTEKEIATTNLFLGSIELGTGWNVGQSVAAQPNAKIGDIIKVTLSDTSSSTQIQVCNSSWNMFDNGGFTGSSTTIEYEITSATVLESIQSNGFFVKGVNATITAIDLLTYASSYDAVPATIGSDGIATFSSAKKVDFSGTGITAYYASVVSSGSITLTPTVDNKAWDYCGYILMGAEGSYNIPVTTGDNFYPSATYLHGQVTSGTVAASTTTKYHYIFAKKKDTGKVGFYKLTADHNLGAHKAYLETDEDITPTGGAQVALIFDDGETTSIDAINTQHPTSNTQCYNLAGQKVSDSYKGIVIKNGKKYINK